MRRQPEYHRLNFRNSDTCANTCSCASPSASASTHANATTDASYMDAQHESAACAACAGAAARAIIGVSAEDYQSGKWRNRQLTGPRGRLIHAC